ncbi:uncharacterized protein N7511_009035 [Penicillium nucicola]|uniref:uncharacterized protein n=1 Tax=Penicillium nucicola TaxID=1850975 RepID=UPI002545089F|nr:uncharacterized protein N7511_009035 [Penicillium nucicola]KAJ5747339.1 hypothetical protein N7511_009035 [Penicillium nucicola]
MAIASMTNLLMSIAALQLVERQIVQLEQNISFLIAALAAQETVIGWDAAGQYTTHKLKSAITVRSLLTHGSGAGNDTSNKGP